MSLIERIQSPDDLKGLPVRNLPALAKEVRDLIVSTVGRNGGHMASNLGAVELTIALHYVFDSPKDRIIFDVSHQSYAHKILTGRASGFENIRTSGGYSGYFDTRESDHDVLTMGHAGCAPSIALGLATAERLLGGHSYHVCVVGDGSLSTGLAYEGLSNIVAQNPRNLMVVLNDNGMSISPNVGWLANWRGRWLPHLRDNLELDKDFQSFEQVAARLATKIPMGELFLSMGKGLKSTIQKGVIPPSGRVWDELGFNYLGPVDGHNIAELVEIFASARAHSDKVPFIHVLTNKGQGWGPSTHDPVRYHQPGPASSQKKNPTYSEVFVTCLGSLMEHDERIVAISAAMLEGTGLIKLIPKFPGRIFDVGICEEHAVSMAAGMARQGLKPVVCIYSTFLQRSFDQVIHDVCMNDLPVVFALDRAGFVGQDGMTHHGLYDLAYMRIAPNMVVAVPRDGGNLCQLLETAVNQRHPFSIRYPRGEAPETLIPSDGTVLEVGRCQVVRPGKAICLAAVGEQVGMALEAAEMLAPAGIDPMVVDVRFVKPIDPLLVHVLMDNFSDVVVVEEGTSVGGLAAALLEALHQVRGVLPRIHHLSVGDVFADHAEISELRRSHQVDRQAIIDKVNAITGGAV